MTGAAAMILAASLGFTICFGPIRALAAAIATFAATAVVTSRWQVAPVPSNVALYGCWASVVITALAVHMPRANTIVALSLAANAGFWAGVVVATAGARSDLLMILPWVLVCLPARWLAERRLQIAVKVAASWLVAVAILSAALPVTTPTPGYAADHME